MQFRFLIHQILLWMLIKPPSCPFYQSLNITGVITLQKQSWLINNSDWKKVIDLIDEAKSLGYKPEDPFEWLTYIEAQALTGNMEAAEKLSNQAFKQDNGIRRGLCEVWKRVQAQVHARNEDLTLVNQILSDFQCVQ